MEPRLFSFLLCAIFVLFTVSAVAGKVYRWVDENGEIHYSESLPPDFQDKKADVIDEQGIVREKGQTLVPPPPETESEDQRKELPRDASGMPRPKALLSEKEMQQQMDRFLLLRYDSEQEIEDAMEVEINQLEYDRGLLQKSRDSLFEAYRGEVKEAANLQRSGEQVDESINLKISDLKERMAKNQVALGGLQAREDNIRKKFGAELERYRYLLETWSEDS